MSSSWADRVGLEVRYGCIYISALRREIEESKEAATLEHVIVRTCDVIEKLQSRFGYVGDLVHEAIGAIEGMARVIGRMLVTPDCALRVCTLVDRHLPAMCALHRSRSLDDEEIQKSVTRLRRLDCGRVNPLNMDRWKELLSGRDDSTLEERGYICVETYHRPRVPWGGFRRFVFARDEDGVEYYVHEGNTSMSEREFEGIQVGDRIWVIPDEEGTTGNATAVRDAIKF